MVVFAVSVYGGLVMQTSVKAQFEVCNVSWSLYAELRVVWFLAKLLNFFCYFLHFPVRLNAYLCCATLVDIAVKLCSPCTCFSMGIFSFLPLLHVCIMC